MENLNKKSRLEERADNLIEEVYSNPTASTSEGIEVQGAMTSLIRDRKNLKQKRTDYLNKIKPQLSSLKKEVKEAENLISELKSKDKYNPSQGTKDDIKKAEEKLKIKKHQLTKLETPLNSLNSKIKASKYDLQEQYNIVVDEQIRQKEVGVIEENNLEQEQVGTYGDIFVSNMLSSLNDVYKIYRYSLNLDRTEKRIQELLVSKEYKSLKNLKKISNEAFKPMMELSGEKVVNLLGGWQTTDTLERNRDSVSHKEVLDFFGTLDRDWADLTGRKKKRMGNAEIWSQNFVDPENQFLEIFIKLTNLEQIFPLPSSRDKLGILYILSNLHKLGDEKQISILPVDLFSNLSHLDEEGKETDLAIAVPTKDSYKELVGEIKDKFVRFMEACKQNDVQSLKNLQKEAFESRLVASRSIPVNPENNSRELVLVSHPQAGNLRIKQAFDFISKAKEQRDKSQELFYPLENNYLEIIEKAKNHRVLIKKVKKVYL